MRFLIDNPNPGSTVDCREATVAAGVTDHIVTVHFEQPVSPESITLRFFVPCRDMFSVWRPAVLFNTALNPDWGKQKTCSALASGAPFHSLISQSGNNRLAIALSDAATPCEIRTGVREEDGTVECEVVLFCRQVGVLSEYRVTVRLVTEDKPCFHVMRDVEEWWRTSCGYPKADIPAGAYEPVYSTWYSYHQVLDADQLVDECREAVKYGMKTLIVDDGWQTDDNHRGYAYCGDWEPCASKFPDVRAFVEKIHQIGMKVMFWYSVPFVGIHSKAYARFEGMYLGASGSAENKAEWFHLDPRYPEVREYITGIYRDALVNWGIDGFKLDFIDSFRLFPETPERDPRRDTPSLEEGIDRLLAQITEALRKINPEVLIEFRQDYIGPVIRKYGNMFRVSDCPLDPMRNRVASAQLLFQMGGAPVHSDMLMWHPDETPEAVSRQLLCCLFSVPQISVRLAGLSEEHRAVLQNFLRLREVYREVLTRGEAEAEHPAALYSSVRAKKDGQTVGVMYADVPFRIPADSRKICVFNCTAGDTLILDRSDVVGERSLRVYDCFGKFHSGRRFSARFPVCAVSVPDGGRVEIE